MDKVDKQELLALLNEQEVRKRYNKIHQMYPDEGPLRRELYVKHLQFFTLGKTRRERLAMAANRVGKTEGIGGYETTLHLTGDYPDWWSGKRFNRSTDCWGAGDTGTATRDVMQQKLLGDYNDVGTGLIPKNRIYDLVKNRHIPEAYETIYVKHESGGLSKISLKSYDQGRRTFQGTKKDVIWFDEEPPMDVYSEGLLRVMDTSGLEEDENSGLLLLTFTPLSGLSDVVMTFVPRGQVKDPSVPYITSKTKAVVTATWDDAPHLSEKEKALMEQAMPPYQRSARAKGQPQMGSGKIYPVEEESIKVKDFEIPPHWPRMFVLDVGWKRTAALWGALDRASGTTYLYSEYYKGEAEPSVHATGIKARGAWIPGLIDPAASGKGQYDGKVIRKAYENEGLDLKTAKNAVEAGILEVWQQLSSGKLKVFASLTNFFSEIRLYRRDEKGNIVKKDDHLMDVARYMCLNKMKRAMTQIESESRMLQQRVNVFRGSGIDGKGWMR